MLLLLSKGVATGTVTVTWIPAQYFFYFIFTSLFSLFSLDSLFHL